MPQLDGATYLSQTFWTSLAFRVRYRVSLYFLAPALGRRLKVRAAKLALAKSTGAGRGAETEEADARGSAVRKSRVVRGGFDHRTPAKVPATADESTATRGQNLLIATRALQKAQAAKRAAHRESPSGVVDTSGAPARQSASGDLSSEARERLYSQKESARRRWLG